MDQLSVKHLLGIKEVTRDDLELIYSTADNFKEVINRPIKKVPSLRDITIANVFFENSTRTRLSFELAEKRLSADIINFSSSQSSVKKGETLLDTINNILAMIPMTNVCLLFKEILVKRVSFNRRDEFEIKFIRPNITVLESGFVNIGG